MCICVTHMYINTPDAPRYACIAPQYRRISSLLYGSFAKETYNLHTARQCETLYHAATRMGWLRLVGSLKIIGLF